MAMPFRSVALLAGALGALVLFSGVRLEAAEVRADWKAEWERTLAAGKREGQVVIYAAPDRMATFREFQKKYPEIKWFPGLPVRFCRG
jgi:hypothetical protein